MLFNLCRLSTKLTLMRGCGTEVALKRYMSEQCEKVNSKMKNTLDAMLESSGFSSIQHTISFCQSYKGCKLQEKRRILEYIAMNYDIDYERVKKVANTFIYEPSIHERLKLSERLRMVAVPKYTEIFNNVARLESGMKYLVDFRSDLLDLLREQNTQEYGYYLMKAMSEHLKKMLSFAFSVGFLQLQRITWDSSCDMLQKVSNYEAVHPVRNWLDLKKRVGPYRRCYVYSHNCMPKEPIVILHTALTEEISMSINSIVTPSQNEFTEFSDICEDPEKIGAAVFYSITSTQKGLRGIELGNYLIKKVVGEVLKEFPHIRKLSSLSPIPGFRDWLLLEIKNAKKVPSISIFTEDEKQSILTALNCHFGENFWISLYNTLSTNRWINNEELTSCLKNPLLRLCAHYLINVKRRSYALNNVAHFHLRNGAVMWRLNWKADLSPRGLSNSCGIMVNYRYYMDETEQNSLQYLEKFDIKISECIAKVLKPAHTR